LARYANKNKKGERMKSYNDYLDEQEQSWIVNSDDKLKMKTVKIMDYYLDEQEQSLIMKGGNKMEMKIVKIIIEVEASKEATHVAVDKNGTVSYRLSNEEYPIHTSIRWNTCHLAKVANWRETLTEIK
jgi:uncharacterized protein YbcV (DUF1398 family)